MFVIGRGKPIIPDVFAAVKIYEEPGPGGRYWLGRGEIERRGPKRRATPKRADQREASGAQKRMGEEALRAFIARESGRTGAGDTGESRCLNFCSARIWSLATSRRRCRPRGLIASRRRGGSRAELRQEPLKRSADRWGRGHKRVSDVAEGSGADAEAARDSFSARDRRKEASSACPFWEASAARRMGSIIFAKAGSCSSM